LQNDKTKNSRPFVSKRTRVYPVLPPLFAGNLRYLPHRVRPQRYPCTCNGVLSVAAYLVNPFGTQLQDVFAFSFHEPLINRHLSVWNQKCYSFFSSSL